MLQPHPTITTITTATTINEKRGAFAPLFYSNTVKQKSAASPGAAADTLFLYNAELFSECLLLFLLLKKINVHKKHGRYYADDAKTNADQLKAEIHFHHPFALLVK